MEFQRICQFFSGMEKAEKTDFLGGGCYYEWQSDSALCLFPHNGADYIWDMGEQKLCIAEHLNHCQWMQGTGGGFLGLHTEAAVPVTCDADKLERWFQELARYEDFGQRRAYVGKGLSSVFEKQKLPPLLEKAVQEAQKYRGRIGIEDLMAKLPYHYSVRQMERLFKSVYGYGPKQFCRKERMIFMLEYLLTHSGQDIAMAIETAGYSDRSHFQREFKSFMGMTPGQFLKEVRKETA